MGKLWDQLQKAEAETPRARQAAPKIAPQKTELFSAPISGKPIAKPEAKRKRGRPLIEERGNTLEALKPWLALGMSRRSWYRRQSKRPGE